jgi:hypothetical protein
MGRIRAIAASGYPPMVLYGMNVNRSEENLVEKSFYIAVQKIHFARQRGEEIILSHISDR